jgi:hypothetical protein
VRLRRQARPRKAVTGRERDGRGWPERSGAIGASTSEGRARALGRLGKVGGTAGGVTLDPSGRVGWAHTSPNIAAAVQVADAERPHACLSRDEPGERADG